MGLGLTAYIPNLVYIFFWLIILLTLFRDAKVGLYLAIFLIPLQNLMDRLVEFPLGKDIFDILMLSIFISIYLNKGGKANVLKKIKLSKIVLLMIPLTYSALWVGSFKLSLSFPVSFDNPQLVQWKNFIMMPLLYFATIKLVEDKKHAKLIILLMALTVLLMNINYYENVKYVSREHFSSEKRSVGSTFSYLGPNEVAAFFAQVAIFFLGVASCEQLRLRKIVIFITACFSFYPVMFLYSRGAYVATIIGLLFLGLMKNRIIFILLLILLMSWQVILPDSVTERIQMTQVDETMDDSALSRLKLWKEALSIIIINPLTGVGFGASEYLGFKTGEGHYRNDVHNGYIEILLEQGILGLILFLSIFFMGLKAGWNLYRHSDDGSVRGMGLGFIGMTIASLVANFFGDRWSYLNLMGYFWIMLGLVSKLVYISKYDNASSLDLSRI